MLGKPKANFIAIFLLPGLLAGGAGGGMFAQGLGERQQRINRAISLGVKNLLSRINDDGSVKGDYPAEDTMGRFGGYNAIVVYALLAAKVDPNKEPKLRRAVDWLINAKLKGTYAVALRACALAELNDPRAIPALKKDVAWLIEAGGSDGLYSYTPKHKSFKAPDNSNSQMAVLGVWAAARRGVGVPDSYWEKVERQWLRSQSADGGWGYKATRRGSSYGSMTAAGLATIFVTFDTLHRMDFVRTNVDADYKPVTRAMDWLAKNFSATRNPRHPGQRQYYYYWLYSAERVGLASGYKYFGEHNWYAEGADALLPIQSSNGGWGEARRRTYQTAFALLFLVRGRYPIVVNKLKYPGRWNARPRDCANLARWLGWTFERPLAWQVIDIGASLRDWHDAPILYISGAGAAQFADKHIRKLREYALQGGTILSEAAGNNGDFTLDMQKVYRKMFPHRPLKRLEDDHPVYNMYFKPGETVGLLGISNGLRTMVIHSPRELSLALQVGQRPDNRPLFELLANIYLLATDKGILSPRDSIHWPKARRFQPVATVTVTRLKHGGNCDPEPLAWRRFATLMGNRYRILLKISEPLPIVLLDAGLHPVAVMTGTEDFTLTREELGALKKYFREGGTLIVDAAGGAREFDRAVFSQILQLPDGAVYGPIALDHPIYRKPEPIEKVTYRRGLGLVLGEVRNSPRLGGVTSGGRLAIIHSREDLTAGLVGYQYHGIRGYSPQSAAEMMRNILYYAARINLNAATKPATQPAGK